MTLCNPGDGILTEEWTYPSACASARPLGMHIVSVKIDSEGMSSEHLESLLSNWDERARGMKRSDPYSSTVTAFLTGIPRS